MGSPAPSVRFTSFLPRSQSTAAMSAASAISATSDVSHGQQNSSGAVSPAQSAYDNTFRYRTVSLVFCVIGIIGICNSDDLESIDD